MTKFFEQYTKLCKEQGKSANGVAKEIGLPSSTITNWKHGKTPRAETLGKIAAYFDVSVDYLQGYTDVKEKPTAGAVSMSAAEAGRYAIEHADSEDELWQLISRAQERIREMNGKK